MNPSLCLPGAVPLMLLGAMLMTCPAQADDTGHTTHLVRVATGASDIIEADVSALELGESQSFVTDSGRTVDILRVPEGIELYLDGELIETGELSATLEDRLALHEELVTIDCDEETQGDCADLIEDLAHAHADGMKVIIARQHVEEICDQDGNCDRSVWISQDGDMTIDIDADIQHDKDHEVIVIRKEIHADSE